MLRLLAKLEDAQRGSDNLTRNRIIKGTYVKKHSKTSVLIINGTGEFEEPVLYDGVPVPPGCKTAQFSKTDEGTLITGLTKEEATRMAKAFPKPDN